MLTKGSHTHSLFKGKLDKGDRVLWTVPESNKVQED